MGTVQYTLVKNDEGTSFISVYVPGRPALVADSSHPQWDEILKKAKAGDAKVADLFDAAKAAADRFEHITERVATRNGRLYFDGDEMNTSLSTQVVRFLKEGVEDWKPLVAFFERVQDNPEPHSREALYNWLEQEDLTITTDGMIVGYKSVHSTGKDTFRSVFAGPGVVNGVAFDGRNGVPQAVGDVVEMPRGQVRHNPNAACSVGLHVGTHNYANGFTGNTILEVIVNPRDVVSVPSDSRAGKMRVCRYRVTGTLTKKHAQALVAKRRVKGGKKTSAKSVILGVLKRRKKQGLDAATIAEKTGLRLQTARTTISRLQKDGEIKAAGSKKGAKGAEVNLYVAA